MIAAQTRPRACPTMWAWHPLVATALLSSLDAHLRAVARGGDVDAFAHEAAQLTTDILAERQKRPPSADLAEAEALAETLLTQRLTTWHLEHASVTLRSRDRRGFSPVVFAV